MSKNKHKMSYDTPSMAIFQNRKRFHAIQKSPSESTSTWFKRLQTSIGHCAFSRISDYMLIDKFVSGLSETDFETISQIPTWTIDELILVVIGSAHIFDSKQVTDCSRQQPIDQQEKVVSPHDTSFIKADPITETKNEEATQSEDALMQESMFQDRKNEIDRRECDAQERKRPLTSAERKINFINRLKESGKFDEYKRKKAEAMARRRLQAIQNEQLLAPELQIHVINQRRRVNRDRRRLQRYHQRTSQKTERTDANVVWLEPYHESTLDTGNYLQIKQESFSGLEYDLEFATADRLEIGQEYGDEPQPETRPQRKSKCNTKRKFTPKPVRRSNVVRKSKRTLECYLCALQCDSLFSLKTHLKIIHPVEGRPILKCYLCDKTTTSRELLTRHLRRFHCEIQMHKCSCCAEKFQRVRDLNQHLRQHHPEYKPFVCEVCGYSTRTKSDLTSHTRVHTGRKGSKCEICGLLLSSSSARSQHMLRHKGVKNHHCAHCDTYFRHSSTLHRHLIRAHGQGEGARVCEICDKRCVNMYNLKLHYNSHTGQRPYECDYCDTSFTQPSSLKLHVRRTHASNLDTNNGITMASGD